MKCFTQLKKTFQVRGFTLPELLIVMVVFSTLIGIITINLTYAQRRASINSEVNTLLSDLKRQQTKAMIGDTEGRASPDNYGINFQANKYVLFHGTTFVATDSANLDIALEGNLHVATPGASIIFTRVSGQVSSYSPSNNTVIIQDATNSTQKTIQYNQLGAFTVY